MPICLAHPYINAYTYSNTTPLTSVGIFCLTSSKFEHEVNLFADVVYCGSSHGRVRSLVTFRLTARDRLSRERFAASWHSGHPIEWTVKRH